MDLQSEQAYAKLQSFQADEIFIRYMPVILGRELEKNTQIKAKSSQNYIQHCSISKDKDLAQDLCILYYNIRKEKFCIIAFQQTYVNNQQAKVYPEMEKFYQEILKGKNLQIFDQFENYSIEVENNSKLYFPTKSSDSYHIYYFMLPAKEQQNTQGLFLKSSQLFAPSQNMHNPMNKVHDKQLYMQWSNDDREQLKKIILQYGYGRWKQIQIQSNSIGGKLAQKQKKDIRAVANGFIRSLAELITQPNIDLKYFLYSIIEEYPNDLYINPNPKDWDLEGQNQRAIAYTKRIQLLYRIKLLIKRFKQNQMRHLKDKSHIIWESLLNFLPNSLLYGQRPSVWWSKKHDTDLLRGVYTFGYANYAMIKSCSDYCFQELELTSTYSSFPSSDTLTRRLKKLLQTIIKNEEDRGKIDFNIQAESDDESKGWTDIEKNCLFQFLLNTGVPLNQDGRSNWLEIRDQLKVIPGFENFDKSISQIEKMVQKIRIDCQQLIIKHEQNQEQQQQKNKYDEIEVEEEKEEGKKDEIKENNNNSSEEQKISLVPSPTKQMEAEFQISYREALKFNKNTNMIYFIRKNMLSNNYQSFQSIQEDLKKESDKIRKNESHYIENQNYNASVHDLNLLKMVSDKGFSVLKHEKEWINYQLEDMGLTVEIIENRLDWLCNIFKQLKENQLLSQKKRKSDKVYKDEVKKKPKFEIQRDEDGNIIYPLVINGSLTLLNVGRICTLPTYHSEHNLFPIGFKTIRAHASMFHKGQRANYTCEIMEGPDGRPLYKVISDEDPDHPIVRDSSTGCWVYVCQRVNDLQEHKKDKVTISGTERFGLLESNVVRLLEDLDNSEKCTRYKFKYRNPNAIQIDDY